jgi:hypothetical protein
MTHLHLRPTLAGEPIHIAYEPDVTLDSLLASDSIDTLITSAEGGLGPLPVGFLCNELAVSRSEIIRWANEISSLSTVTMVALRSRKPGGKLRGAILVPFGTADCCKALVAPENRGLPWRDLYYNVTFESIAYACKSWGSAKFVTHHLSGCGQAYHPHIPGCQVEALAHFAKQEHADKVQSFRFLDCCCGTIKRNSFDDVSEAVNSLGSHRAIEVTEQRLKDDRGHVISLKW